MKAVKSNWSPEHDQYVVAIGASAGGLEAIHEFFDNMPSNGRFSFVIIQHLSPDYKSLLVELVAKHTNMKVVEAQDHAPVEQGYVYVIPNNKLLTISSHKLRLSEKKFEKAPNTAIDTFLKSLAEDQGAKAVAIILSGTGTDGTRGIAAIHEGGGMVLVQDPISAKFDGMPNSAINSGNVDYILTPELMPEELFNYIKERPVRIAAEGGPDEALLPEVLKLVEKNCQHDFHNYKTPTILRRIGRRMNQLGYKKFSDYLNFMRVSADECKILGKEFLIGVTKFFRDKAAFDLLRDEVLPEIIRSKGDGDILKVWVTACSTGEEAYSIAILIDDLVNKAQKEIEVKIFATDIDGEAIEFASKGVYPAANISEIDADLQRKYFTRQGTNVVVSAELRKLIVFAKHNILKDPPFIKNDLVTCRNMLIYMNNILQRKVLSTLQFALNTGGCLFLGPSEIPASVREGFEEINSKWKLFRKIASDNRYNPEKFPSAQISRTHPQEHERRGTNGTLKVLADDFKNILTEEYGFAAVYVDRNMEIREAVGDFKKYLSLPDRISSLQILKMVSSDLSVALNAAIRKAVKENTKVVLKTVRIKKDGDEKPVNIFVRPSAQDGYTLVVFGESHELPLTKAVSEFTPQNSQEAVTYISELEEELKDTRASLQLTVESLETANEELQSSNEELLSANEELQSSNEELQSLNEELHTLNTEHQLRIKELIELNDDLNNYFRSSEVAQIFVDNDLNIRKFNPTAVKMVNLIESDIGRPIDHISTNIQNSSLTKDINTVIRSAGIIEKEVRLHSGRMSLMRILPYLRQDNVVDGVVVTFIDISRVKELDNIIKAVFNSSLSAIMAFRSVKDDHGNIIDFQCIAANRQADELLGKPFDDYSGKSLKEELPELMHPAMFSKAAKIVRSGVPVRTEVQLHMRGSGGHWYELAANQMGEGLVLTLTNIDEKRRADEKFRQNYQELIRVKENYRNLNIELEEKVKERTLELSQGEERFRLIANAASDAIWDWDLVRNSIWWSESFYTRFGFDRNEKTNAGDFWIEQIHPDDRKRIRQDLHEAIQKGSSWSGKCRLKKADGTYAIILNRGTVSQDENGISYRMVGAMMDITEAELADQKLKVKNDQLQKVLEEFRFVTNFIPQIVWATQPDGAHDYFNKQWFDYTGLSFEQTKGDGWKHAVHAEDQPKAWRAWQHALKSGEPYEIEYRLRRHDGEYHWFLARALPLTDDQKIVKWFGTCTDIHDQRLANDVLEQKVIERTAELQKANTDLEASNIELLQFASVASHDLKEPLRKIHIFGNLIKDRYLSKMDGAADYMERIITASARMTKLINDLLTFTRLSSTTSFENVSLNRMVDEVMSDLELAITEKHAIIEVDDMPKLDVITGQIRQVFQNLISNALKFARKEERPRIKITCELVNRCAIDARADNKGEFCRIVISDNGIGFNNEYKEKIFTIFQRLHSKEQYEGTGIGLAITRKIIERHNGVIAADGAENQGATFVIVLPLKQEVTIPIEINQN